MRTALDGTRCYYTVMHAWRRVTKTSAGLTYSASSDAGGCRGVKMKMGEHRAASACAPTASAAQACPVRKRCTGVAGPVSRGGCGLGEASEKEVSLAAHLFRLLFDPFNLILSGPFSALARPLFNLGTGLRFRAGHSAGYRPVCKLNIAILVDLLFGYDHTFLATPLLVRSAQLSRNGRSQVR